ncbi:MAG TPA: plastocyanin/azurin family copper-binding protein [Solirubrobacterales bacterium]|jgi:plastocyanin|nr:plastocyanin/azurin family copper-binding protein [Solirubrobacterales bacterium]
MKKVAALLALALASVALVACGSSSDNSSTTTATSGGGSESTSGGAAGGGKEEGGGGGGGSTVKFEADPNGELAYTTTTATAKAGTVTVDFNNPQELTHDVAIEDSSGKEVGATELIAGGSDSTTVNLKPGTYHYFCTVPGHREAGMEGTLTVK